MIHVGAYEARRSVLLHWTTVFELGLEPVFVRVQEEPHIIVTALLKDRGDDDLIPRMISVMDITRTAGQFDMNPVA